MAATDNTCQAYHHKISYLQVRHLELLVPKFLHKLVYLRALDSLGGCELVQGLVSG